MLEERWIPRLVLAHAVWNKINKEEWEERRETVKDMFFARQDIRPDSAWEVLLSWARQVGEVAGLA